MGRGKSVGAGPYRMPAWTEKGERIRRLFEACAEQGWFNGRLLVAKDGEPIADVTAGWADRYRRRRLTADTMFNVASVGKTFTAAAVLLLVQEGRLRLDEPIDRWFPELPWRGAAIRQLLAHTSGIPNYIPLVRKGLIETPKGRTVQADNAGLLRNICEAQPEPDFPPGERNCYSNTGYMLLAMLIEKVADVPFHDFLERRIFRPCGFARLTECRHSDRAERLADYAVGHWIWEDGEAVPPHTVPGWEFVWYLDAIQGDGNVHASAAELLRWDRVLRTEELLGRAALGEAYRPARLNDGSSARNGLGWFVADDSRRGRKVSHAGYWPGYSAEFDRWLDRDIVVIYMSNEEREGSHELRNRMMRETERILFEV